MAVTRLSRRQARRLRRAVLSRRVAPYRRKLAWERLAEHYVTGDPGAARAVAALVSRPPRRSDDGLLRDDPLRPAVCVAEAWRLVVPPSPAAPELLAALRAVRRPALDGSARTANLLLSGEDPLVGGEQSGVLRQRIAEFAAYPDHPVGRAARTWILAARDPALTELVCRRALAEPVPREPNLAWWCRENGLRPGDGTARVDFLLRIGDVAGYRRADPDGTRLAVLYRAVGTDARFALRQALINAGAFDLLRGLPALGDGAGIAPDERSDQRELIDLLVDAEDWPRLWAYAAGASLRTAVEISRRITGWQPADRRTADLFGRLRAADLDTVGRTVSALADHAPYEIPHSDLIGRSGWSTTTALSFAPDGSRVLIAGSGTGLIELGATADTAPRVLPAPPGLVHDAIHLGASVVTVEGDDHRFRLVRYLPGRRPKVLRTSTHRSPLYRTPDGFVALLSTDTLVYGTADPADGLREVPLPVARDTTYVAGDFLVGGDGATGRTLVHLPKPGALLVLDAAGELVARTAPDTDPWDRAGVFVGPDRIVTDGPSSWRIVDGELVREEAKYDRYFPTEDGKVMFGIGVHGLAGFLHQYEQRFVDARTLRPAAHPAEWPDDYVRLYFDRQSDPDAAPRGTYHSDYGGDHSPSGVRALHSRGDDRLVWRTEEAVYGWTPVLPVVGAVAERPPGALADLTTLAAARRLVPAGGAEAEVIDLLRARLELRYDAAITLGDGRTTVGGDEIAIRRTAGHRDAGH